MKTSKCFLSTLIAAAAMTATAYADAAYTSTTTGVGTATASLTLDSDTTQTLSGKSIDLSSFTGTLELSGNDGGTISTVTTNGGWGGRVWFKESSWASGLTTILLNAGIEADLGNVASYSGLTISADNASMYFGVDGSTFAANLHVGDGGLRLNGGSYNSQTFTGAITGSGKIFNITGDLSGSKTLTFTGDISGFAGTWATRSGVYKVFQFGDGSAAATNGEVGGTFGESSQSVMVKFNYAGDYSVDGDIYAKTLEIASGTATLGGTITLASSLSLTGGAVTFADTASLVFSGLTATSSTSFDESVNGLQSVGMNYAIISGSGTISGLTVDKITVEGVKAKSLSDDMKTVTVGRNIYNVSATTLTDISMVNSEIGDSSVAYINVAGTLNFGETAVAISEDIQGAGTIKIVSTAGGHAVSITNADGFSGTVDFTGKLNTGSLNLGENATLKLSKSGAYSSLWGGGTIACNVLFQTDYQIGDSSGTTITFSGDVSGAENTTLTILSNSTANFSGSASFANLSSSGMTVFNGDVSGNLVASAGTIRFDAARTHRTYKSNITLENSATLSIYDASAVSASSEGNYQFAFTGDIAVNGTNTLASNWGKEIAFQGDLSGEGSLTYTRATDGGINMNGRLIVDGEDKDFSGTITVDASNNNSLGIDLNASLANATIVLTGGSSNPAFMSIWKDVSVKRLDGTGEAKIGVGYASTSSMTDGNFKLTIGEGRFSGIIQDKSYQRGSGTSATLVTDGVLGIIKNTEGTLTLSGDNTYSGGTTVAAGTLVAASASALGTGSVKVVSGATLQADTAITLSSDLTLAVSDADLTGSGLIKGSGVMLDSSAKLLVDITGLTSVASTESADSVALQLAANSALSVSQEQIKLGYWSDASTWTDYTGDWFVDSWDSATGVLTLAIPEPSLFGLVAGLGALTLVGTRRRRKRT